MERFLVRPAAPRFGEAPPVGRAERLWREKEIADKIGLPWPPAPSAAKRAGPPTFAVLYNEALQGWVRKSALEGGEPAWFPSLELPEWWRPGRALEPIAAIETTLAAEDAVSALHELSDAALQADGDCEEDPSDDVGGMPAKKRAYVRPPRDVRAGTNSETTNDQQRDQQRNNEIVCNIGTNSETTNQIGTKNITTSIAEEPTTELKLPAKNN